MIRFLDDREVSSLQKNYCKIVSSKILSLDKNVGRFYKEELTLDFAIKTYIHLLNAGYFHKASLDAANKIMGNYMNNEKEFESFFTEVKPLCNYYGEDPDYYDGIYELFEDVSRSMIDVLVSNLNEFSNTTVTTIYSLIYDFHDDEIYDDKSREMFFSVRKEILDFTGGYCNAVYWYPEYMKDASIEEKLPEEEELHELFQTECYIIGVQFDKSCNSENNYLAKSFNKTIEYTGDGAGIISEIFYENNNLFLTITADTTMNINYSTFIVLSIIVYTTKRRWLLGKDNSRVC